MMTLSRSKCFTRILTLTCDGQLGSRASRATASLIHGPTPADSSPAAAGLPLIRVQQASEQNRGLRVSGSYDLPPRERRMGADGTP